MLTKQSLLLCLTLIEFVGVYILLPFELFVGLVQFVLMILLLSLQFLVGLFEFILITSLLTVKLLVEAVLVSFDLSKMISLPSGLLLVQGFKLGRVGFVQ